MPRKEKKYHFIYKTTNLLTEKYYIGMHSTDNLDDGYIGSGRRLKYSVNKYGKENHAREIIEFLENRSELIKREKQIITLDEIAKEECMNLNIGGDGGRTFKTEEEKYKFHAAGGKKVRQILALQHLERLKNDKDYYNKFCKSLKGKKNFLGKKHTQETKEKISISHKGKGIGETNSQFGTIWITNGNQNKKVKSDLIIPEGWHKGRILKLKLN
jgi:hypothetical protein